jgi:hypothetical protein
VRPAKAHFEVRSAPWIDVRMVEILVDSVVVYHRDLPKRETSTGKENGTLEEAMKRTLRLVDDVELKLTDKEHWAMLIVRGDESLERYLPATAMKPLAFTNPIWLTPKREPKKFDADAGAGAWRSPAKGKVVPGEAPGPRKVEVETGPTPMPPSPMLTPPSKPAEGP